MKTLRVVCIVFSAALLAAGCSRHTVRCDGLLRPINAPEAVRKKPPQSVVPQSVAPRPAVPPRPIDRGAKP